MPKKKSPKSAKTTTLSVLQATHDGSRSLIETLNIGTKIGLGYAIALGIATLGTGVGMAVGYQVERHAQTQQVMFAQAEELINTLQLAIFEVRTNELQLLRMARSPQEAEAAYADAKMRIDRADILLADFETTLERIEQNPQVWGRGAGVAQYLLTQRTTAMQYLEAQNQLLEDGWMNRATTPTADWQASVADFSASPVAQDLEDFALQLHELVQVTHQLETGAEQDLIRAERLRQQTVLGSMVLSVVLAVFFATYTSRAIARPIREVTQVARQVTDDANFELQAPITTADEVGFLAYSLNKLIRRVKDLLAAQQEAAEARQRLQKEQLLQAEKMSSLGRMLAGVAHEINNPVNFIYGNLSHANQYIADLLRLLDTYQREVPNPPAAVTEVMDEIELAFLLEDLPQLLASVELGAERTRQIVMSLKNVSRMDSATPHPVELESCIDSALLILHNRIKHGIDVVRDYSTVPPIEGFSGLLYQVFMNLISNALDALDEEKEQRSTVAVMEPAQNGTAPPAWQPTLTLALVRWGADWVQVRVADNGCGIAPDQCDRIFEAFYTSKPVGVGTGLGLSITREIIEDKHHGSITCHSKLGEGTEFILTLPIRQTAPIREPAKA